MSQTPSFNAKDVSALLGAYRWAPYDQSGSHEQYKHPVLPGKITLERHASKDLPTESARDILKHAGMLHFYKMFQHGAPWRNVEKAIRAEAKELFPTQAEREEAATLAAAAKPAAQPAPQIS